MKKYHLIMRAINIILFGKKSKGAIKHEVALMREIAKPYIKRP